jgi:hypothetical protein
VNAFPGFLLRGGPGFSRSRRRNKNLYHARSGLGARRAADRSDIGRGGAKIRIDTPAQSEAKGQRDRRIQRGGASLPRERRNDLQIPNPRCVVADGAGAKSAKRNFANPAGLILAACGGIMARTPKRSRSAPLPGQEIIPPAP